MNPKELVIIGNPISDPVRLKRGIYTDSPAATKKIIDLTHLLDGSGVVVTVISLGCGRSIFRNRYFRGESQRISLNSVLIYNSYYSGGILSSIVSALALLKSYYKFAMKSKEILFYNRTPYYLPVLLLMYVTRKKCYLDLEDLETKKENFWHSFLEKLTVLLSEKVCVKGVLLANATIGESCKIRPQLCYYGYVKRSKFTPLIPSVERETHILFSGSLTKETGLYVFIKAYKWMVTKDLGLDKKIVFHVSNVNGKIEELIALSRIESKNVSLVYHGRLSTDEYQDLLVRCNIGLSLKLNSGIYANTTFPSKVIEYAKSGLAVITSDISDVRKIFGFNVHYLITDEHRDLENLIIKMLEDNKVESFQEKAFNVVHSKLSRNAVADMLLNFFE